MFIIYFSLYLNYVTRSSVVSYSVDFFSSFLLRMTKERLTIFTVYQRRVDVFMTPVLFLMVLCPFYNNCCTSTSTD